MARERGHKAGCKAQTAIASSESCEDVEASMRHMLLSPAVKSDPPMVAPQKKIASLHTIGYRANLTIHGMTNIRLPSSI